MGIFDGYLLVSDFDGTLIDHNSRVSDENVQAVQSFIAQGGRFCGATGRTELNVVPYVGALPLSSPWILYNGAAIYDWGKRDFIHKALLDGPLVQAFIRKVIARFPDINIQVFPGGPFYQINPTAAPDPIAVKEGQHFEEKPMEEIPSAWLKVIFYSHQGQNLDAIKTMLDADPLNNHAHSMRSAQHYFELTAQGVNKGSALRRLKEILEPKARYVIAIGDYHNDIEMLQEADIPAAPESALPEVKAHAKIVTACHTQSAIADLLRKLEESIQKSGH